MLRGVPFHKGRPSACGMWMGPFGNQGPSERGSLQKGGPYAARGPQGAPLGWGPSATRPAPVPKSDPTGKVPPVKKCPTAGGQVPALIKGSEFRIFSAFQYICSCLAARLSGW